MRFQATEEQMKITGRTLFENGVRILGWSGSGVTFRFFGRQASAKILSNPEDWEAHLKARIAVYVRENPAKEEASQPKVLMLEKGIQEISLFESEEPKDVTITIMKYSEAPFAYCGIEWIETDGKTLLPPPEASSRRMEIIGDSITCGYGVEADSELIPFSTDTENPTLSYSMLLAGKLQAEVNLVSWSGNGIISHYVDESAAEPGTGHLMPEIYPYTDISAEEQLKKKQLIEAGEERRWDFSRFVPALVLINLGTNDCSWCRTIPERNAEFKAEYRKFLKEVRKYNPDAVILCVLGTMDERLLTEIREAVSETAKETQDKRLHFQALPPQDPADGYGSDWHPSKETHRKTAELLAGKISALMGWETV